MNIINNLIGNHYQRLIDIAKNGDILYIVSPFLMEAFDTLFFEFKDMGIRDIHLITTLKNGDIDLIRKANSLHSFCRLCIDNGIKYHIYIDNDLHGKFYMSSKNDEYTCGMLTSANFTDSGLNHKHEWGIWIDDSSVLETLIKEVLGVCSLPLSYDGIVGIIDKVDNYTRNIPEPPQSKLELSVDEFIDFGNDESIHPRTIASDVRYFIKPVGHSESPYPESSRLDSYVATMRFSNRKPRAVRVGDILICYAVGSTKLLGYFEVLTTPVFSNDTDDRWPWSVQAKNLCPIYSENWAQRNNTLSRVKDKFNIDTPITFHGGKTLGALNFGADKIRLTQQFADHLIKTIEQDAVAKECEGISAPNAALEEKLRVELISNTKECRKLGYNPTAFLEMLNKYGALGTVQKLIHAPHVSDGYSKLFMLGRLDLTLEAIMLKPEYQILLTKDELAICVARIQ